MKKAILFTLTLYLAISEVYSIPRELQDLILENDSTNDDEIGSHDSIRVARSTTVNRYITLSKTSDYVPVGSSLTITCTGNSSDISWTNPQHISVPKASSASVHEKDTFKKSSNKSELIFNNVQIAQQGVYSCADSKHYGFANFTLSVYIKPSAKISPSKANYEEGDNFNITCSGNSPNITWRNPQNILIPSFAEYGFQPIAITDTKLNTSILMFKNSSTWMSGSYSCSVNASGLQDNGKVTVNIKMSTLEFDPDKQQITKDEGKDFDITCEGAVTSLTWTHNGKEVSTNTKDDVYMKEMKIKGRRMSRKLKFDDLKTKYIGKYVCSGASSYNGKHLERSFELNVREDNNIPEPTFSSNEISLHSLTLRKNSTFRVECIGSTEDIQWTGPPYDWKIPEQSPPTSAIYAERVTKKKVALVFQNVTYSNEGKYTCRVTKRTVTKENYFNLRIIEPTYLINITKSPYVAYENHNATLECNVGGNPKPVVNWYFYTVQNLLQQGSKYKFKGDNLQIMNITQQDQGFYMCKASQNTDKGLTIEEIVNVVVPHKPYFTASNVTVEVLFGRVNILPCNCSAYPAPWYSWYKNNATVYTISGNPAVNMKNNTLEIYIGRSTDLGYYLCNATNTLGSSAQWINAIQMMPPLAPQVHVMGTTKNSVRFKLLAERNATITYFNIEYKESPAKSWSNSNKTKEASWSTDYSLGGLKPKTEYVLRVRSVNPIGISGFSSETKFTTSFAVKLSTSLGPLLIVIISIYVYNFAN